ncbi:hypothetical protein [Enterococcus termitis]|uniref:Uncharacterized protein n=1 Tax=Enterococcus termitis TaxID=332950 RepID=A0A1E5GJC5_9ENTE|nr:hypothetical protein [Enterococcus termitis]OEG12798.1 hypothetical protein BCR25_19345 [Enterococcus termitis]OJG95194.1 hypothetical protein RV18_GL003149 [Enterococcus termitis]
MVIIDVYGRINKTKISDKLKIYISNLPTDWKEGIIEDMLKEIRQQKIDIDENVRAYGKSFHREYSLEYLREIVQINVANYAEYNLNSIENCVECLADNLVYLFFDYTYQDMPFFDWTTNCFDGRLCEEDYAEKVINFCNFINKDIDNGIHMNCIYTSNMNDLENTRILLNLGFRIRSEFNGWKSTEDYIHNLKLMGNRIDSIIKSENDYYKFDYIMNGIFEDNNYNQNHFLKTFTLLELTLLTPNQKTKEIDSLLAPYLKKIYEDDCTTAARILRQMRNKIGHGDFKNFIKKSEEFAGKFMKNYNFDYSEYSRQNWILLHTCCLLDDLLREVLYQQIEEAGN